MLSRKSSLKRTGSLKRGGPLKKVSKKRKAELGFCYEKRKAFLLAHPYCQIWLKLMQQDEKEIIAQEGFAYPVPMAIKSRFEPVYAGVGTITDVPRSTEIHHTNHREGKRLNDERYWLAVSREHHKWAHAHPREAKALGIFL